MNRKQFLLAHLAFCLFLSTIVHYLHRYQDQGPIHDASHDLLDLMIVTVLPVFFASYLHDRLSYLTAAFISFVVTVDTIWLIRDFEVPGDITIVTTVLVITVFLGEYVKKTVNRRDAALAEADQTKILFVAKMSHEIRTPMNTIIGSANLLAERNLSGSLGEYVDNIQRSGDNILRIIDDILIFTRLETGNFEIQVEPMDLAATIDSVSSQIRPKAERKGLRLSLKIQHEIPNWVLGDSVRIQQILVNLLDNSVKFSLSGVIELDISTVDEDPECYRFIVTDQGIGIPSDKSKQIYNAFAQFNSQTVDSRQGAGLGLAITQALVQAMGGVIELDSQRERGTKFTVILPLKATSRPLKSTKPKTTIAVIEAAELKNIHSILLVEDNPLNQTIAKRMLEVLGCRVSIAENGKQALDCLEHETFDLILMDLQMPVMDGQAATRELRKREALTGAHIPVVAMTAHAMDGVKEECLEAGMDDFLTKPVKLELLRSALNKAAYITTKHSAKS